jgi:hypothetical protein
MRFVKNTQASKRVLLGETLEEKNLISLVPVGIACQECIDTGSGITDGFVEGAVANELRMKYGQVRVDGIHPQALNTIELICSDPIPSIELFHPPISLRFGVRREDCPDKPQSVTNLRDLARPLIERCQHSGQTLLMKGRALSVVELREWALESPRLR